MLSKAIRAVLYALAIAILLGAAALAPARQALAQPSSGTNVPAATTGYAMAIPPRNPLAPKQVHAGPSNHPLLTPDPVALKQAKKVADDRAAASQRTRSATAAVTRPYSVYNATNFSGIDAATANGGCCTPSDSTGAIGPNDYVEVVNSAIQVRDRSGNIVSALDLASFGAFSPSDCTFDPQISWDQQAGRFLYSFLDQGPNCGAPTTDYIDFGWSINSDPSNLATGWCLFGFNTDGMTTRYLFDYDKLGHDNHFINIGANVFSDPGTLQESFRTSIVMSVPKPANGVKSCTPPSLTIFGSPGAPLLNGNGTMAWTPVPADTADSSGVGYIVAAHNGVFQFPGPAQHVMVWHVSLSGGAAALTRDGDVAVTAYGTPPSIPQPATGMTSCSTAGNCLDSLDGRLTQAVAHFDPDAGVETIWTQHAVTDLGVGAGPLSVERWYEIIPGHNSGPRQQGNVSDSSLYIFNGAISPTMAGNEAVIFYNAGDGSAGNFASFRAQSRNSSTSLGTFTNETILATSAANDNDFSCGVNLLPQNLAIPCRWGDYSAARPDPMNSNAVWGTTMLTGAGGSGPPTPSAGWATQVAAYTPGCSTVTVTPPSPTFVDGSINAITATAAGCNNPEYAFWVQYPAGTGTWTLKQAFSASSTWNWDSSGYAAGSYLIHVWANQIGDSTASLEALGSDTALLTAAPACTSAGVTPPTSTQPAGPTINFNATAATCPFPVFAYYVQDPSGMWTLKRPFSTDPTYAWDTTGLVSGHYTIHVWANRRGYSTASPEAVGVATAAINICSGASVAGPGSNPAAGSVVVLTASSSGCTGPRYEFWVQYPGGSWNLKQGFGGPTFNWDTTGLAPGSYTVHAWVNTHGTGFDAVGEAIVTLTGCASASIAPPTVSQLPGSTVNLTASSMGCPNPQYEFWVQDPSGNWSLKRGFGAASFSWVTTGVAAGTYVVHAWAIPQGAAQTMEVFGTSTVSLAGCDLAAISPPSPSQPAGSLFAFSATSSGCTSPHYEFWVQYPDGSWNLKQPFGLSAMFNWNTAGRAPGAYTFHAWASATGVGHDSVGSASVTLTGCTTASVTLTSPAPAGTVVNMTGAGDAGCPNPQFEYWVQYPDMTWHFGRTWGPAAWGWVTSGLRPGDYTIHAWTNQIGASIATYEAIGSAAVTLSGCTAATVTPSAGTDPVGTTITFTVAPVTCSGTPVYEFWVQYPDGTWHQGTSFTITNKWNWMTTGRAKGGYVIHVWVNNQGADTSIYETIGSANHTLN